MTTSSGSESKPSYAHTPSSFRKTWVRTFSLLMVVAILLYCLSRFFIFWHDWPNLSTSIQAVLGNAPDLSRLQFYKGISLLLVYIGAFIYIYRYIKRTSDISLSYDADKFKRMSFYIIRVAFWMVFLVGLGDAIVSFLRVEELLIPLVGDDIAAALDQPRTRGLYLHYPLIALSFIIAWFSRSLGFYWLALLVVFSEFFIVITRFIFSYEQAFMGDLVRFWYAAFFLFASAYTLIEGGHVRVDVLYARLGNRKKAWVNLLGSILLGLPLCWIILYFGMDTRQSSLMAPILSFEVSSSGYGMYVKYIMGSFLLIYAVSMAIMFVSYFLSSSAYLMNEPDALQPQGGEH